MEGISGDAFYLSRHMQPLLELDHADILEDEMILMTPTLLMESLLQSIPLEKGMMVFCVN
jgi:hypothetical protein